MSFPIGEQFFIDAVKQGFKVLPPEQQEKFRAEVQGFAGQEATHRRIHSLFNIQLERQGLVNEWEPRAAARLKLLEGADPRHALAITAANEHFTAIFAEWIFGTPDLFAGSEPRLATLWQWHSAEESEHKSTAFDLYQALGGSHEKRISWFRRVTLIFLGDTLRQTVANLQRDGTLWRWRTWKSARALAIRQARPRARDAEALAGVPAAGLPSAAAGKRACAPLAQGQRGRVCGGRFGLGLPPAPAGAARHWPARITESGPGRCNRLPPATPAPDAQSLLRCRA